MIFVVDATGSRERAWDMASKTQAEMFQEAARIGTLDVQLVYFRGTEGFGGECEASHWTNNARELAELLRAVAAFATGGLTALSDLRSQAAVRLLRQLK